MREEVKKMPPREDLYDEVGDVFPERRTPVNAFVSQVCLECSGRRYITVTPVQMPEDDEEFPLKGKRCPTCKGTGTVSVEKTLYEY